MTAPTLGAVERALHHDRMIVLGAVAVLTLLAGFYTVLGVGMDMSALDVTRTARAVGAPMQMDMAPDWTAAYAGLAFLMWWIMMIAVMTPSAAPTLLLFAALRRRSRHSTAAKLHVGLFLGGYLVVWAGFSVAATGLQWGLQAAGFIAGLTIATPAAAGAALIVAGAYQFSPSKDACLRHCQSPAQFLSEHRRPGRTGALLMGMNHGVYCLGCCWALMSLLFVGGIMNLFWIVGIVALVALEKLTPFGRETSRLSGAVLIGSGGWMVLWG